LSCTRKKTFVLVTADYSITAEILRQGSFSDDFRKIAFAAARIDVLIACRTDNHQKFSLLQVFAQTEQTCRQLWRVDFFFVLAKADHIAAFIDGFYGQTKGLKFLY